MYKLTLSLEDRKAFDWVGGRYATGEDFFDVLWLDCETDKADFDFYSQEDVTFSIPENKAWGLKELAESEDMLWPCFGDELKAKLNKFIDSIV